MTGARFVCCDEGRRSVLLQPKFAAWSGIDYVEVRAGATTADPTTITITLVRAMPPATASLTIGNFRLTGGTRFAPPPLSPMVTLGMSGTKVASYTLTIPGGHPTDYSLYRLAMVAAPGSEAPPGFIDPRLSAVDIDFKLACPRDVDCAPECDGDAELPAEDATFDYRTRDWPMFRQAMLDRLAALVPGFRGDDPLDLTVTLVEMLAAEADRQSYRLDWIGTEAFLPTARSRTSVARHARLVGYRPGEGVSARCFVQFAFAAGLVPDGMPLAQSTPLLLRQDGIDPVVAADDWPAMIPDAAIVFETIADVRLWEWRSAIAFHTWSDDSCRLAKGATAATLVDGSPSADAALKPGDLLLLRETVSPENGKKADASPAHRHVVRLTRVTPVVDPLAPVSTRLVDVAWDSADALPFELVIQSRGGNETSAQAPNVCADASANLVVADHGLSLSPAAALGLQDAAMEALRPRLDPPVPTHGARWRPVLDRADVARIVPPRADRALPPDVPASRLLAADAASVLPALGILDAFSSWKARTDLLASDPFDRGFVVEAGIGGRAELRFGDGIHGLAPAPGSSFAVQGRFGSGLVGNIGSDSLGHVVLPAAQAGATITAVTNPLPARSGADPEPIASVRLSAPYAFRRQDRAVTPEDYVAAARRHPEVSAALAIPRWTGAFQTMLVYVDRRGGLPADRGFLAAIATHLEQYRLMGIDVAVRAAVPAPLDIELFVCAVPGALRGMVGARVRDALHPRRADGSAGFFDPDLFTFGAPLRLSALIAAVMAVEGVQSVEVTTFQRYGRVSAGELAKGVIHAFGAEVLELADDPSFPERGRLRIRVGGGR